MDGRRILAHADDPLRCLAACHEVQVRELGDRMPHLLIDRPGHFAPLNMRHRNVQVGGCDGCSDRFKAVGDRDDHVRLQVVEHRCQLEHPEAGRLGHGSEITALEHHVYARGDLEPILLDIAHGHPIAVKQR